MDRERISEIVTQLKVVKKEKGYSYQKIAAMTEDIGDPVSLSTIKRVFTDDAHSFRWDTIRPIATVLLGVGFETPKPDEQDPDQPQRYYAVIEGLKSLVEAKGELIASKDESIRYLKKQLLRQQIATAVLTIVVGVMLVVTLVSFG